MEALGFCLPAVFFDSKGVKMAKIHKSVTLERLMEMVDRRNNSLDNPGICLACGEEDFSCDPDTSRKTCEHCGYPSVYGAEEALWIKM